MATSLSLYGTNVASSVLVSAGLLAKATGAAGNSQATTKVGTSTGYGEVYARGNTGAWAAAGSIGAASGHGWIYDPADLDNQTVSAGVHTPKFRASVSVGSLTVDMYVNAYKLAADLVTYTLIGTCALTAQTVNTSLSIYTFAGTSLSAMSFGIGEKLYYDVWFNVTANTTGSSSATIAFTYSNSATLGKLNNAEFDTPGYTPAVTVNMTITDAGRNLIRNAKNGSDSARITYVALGTSNAAPTTGDTALGAEVFRKAVTTYTNGLTGEALISMYLAPTDAVGVNIAEVGYFGGNAASLAANSGTLYARGLYTHNNKTNLESLQFTIDDLTTL